MNVFRHDEKRRRFVLELDEGEAFVSYSERDGVLHLTYSEVPWEQRGHGIGRELVIRTFEYIRKQGWKARPICGYIVLIAKRNPEFSDIMG